MSGSCQKNCIERKAGFSVTSHTVSTFYCMSDIQSSEIAGNFLSLLSLLCYPKIWNSFQECHLGCVYFKFLMLKQYDRDLTLRGARIVLQILQGAFTNVNTVSWWFTFNRRRWSKPLRNVIPCISIYWLSGLVNLHQNDLHLCFFSEKKEGALLLGSALPLGIIW